MQTNPKTLTLKTLKTRTLNFQKISEFHRKITSMIGFLQDVESSWQKRRLNQSSDRPITPVAGPGEGGPGVWNPLESLRVTFLNRVNPVTFLFGEKVGG